MWITQEYIAMNIGTFLPHQAAQQNSLKVLALKKAQRGLHYIKSNWSYKKKKSLLKNLNSDTKLIFRGTEKLY